MKLIRLHKIFRGVSNTTQEILCERLIRKDLTREEKEECLNDLKECRKHLGDLEDSFAKIQYKEGKKDGILDGILIGEFLMLGSYGLGKLIRYCIDKRA